MRMIYTLPPWNMGRSFQINEMVAPALIVLGKIPGRLGEGGRRGDAPHNNHEEEIPMYLPHALYEAKPYLLAITGATAAFYLPATGRIGGVLLLTAALMIVYVRRQARAARLARAGVKSR